MPLDDASILGFNFLVILDFRMVVEVTNARQEFTLVLHLRRYGL